MKTILATFFVILLILPASAIGEIQTIIHTVKQPFGGSQSPDDARIAAVAKAKRESLEMAGTYIESLTMVKDSQINKDEILALAAGVLKTEIISQQNYHTQDSFGIEITVKVVVDTSVLDTRVKKLLQDRTHLEQLNQTRIREGELLKRIAVLEEENRKSGSSDGKKAALKKEFHDASQSLTAIDWFDKAYALWLDQRFVDPPKAIEYLNQAILLKPDYVDAYFNRGIAYIQGSGQYQRAIDDFNKAILLKPDYYIPYYNRGHAYYDLGLYQKAIEDFDKTIILKPDYADAIYNRGVTYAKLGQDQRAIKEYDKAIRMKPDYADAYCNRGVTYAKLG